MQDKKDNSPIRADDTLTGVSLAGRTKKLVTALYMVTDCIDQTDPLRYALRSSAVELLFEVRELSQQTSSEQHLFETEVIHSVESILEQLDIAFTIGFISQMNHMILVREFTILKESIQKRQASRYIGDIRALFGTGASAERLTLPKDFFDTTDTVNHTTSKTQTTTEPTTVSKYYKGQFSEKSPVQKNPATDQKDRKEKIVRIIKDKKQVMIKDIAEVITDCSEKTIQRELALLVTQGVLKKIGDKRWSKYELR